MRNWSKFLNNSCLTNRSPYHFYRFAIARSDVELKSVALQSRKNGHRSSAPVAEPPSTAFINPPTKGTPSSSSAIADGFFVRHRTRRPKRVCSGAIINQRLDDHARRSPVLIGASGRTLIAGDPPNFCFLLASRFHAKVAKKDRLRL
jgi:hypothetical protein